MAGHVSTPGRAGNSQAALQAISILIDRVGSSAGRGHGISDGREAAGRPDCSAVVLLSHSRGAVHIEFPLFPLFPLPVFRVFGECHLDVGARPDLEAIRRLAAVRVEEGGMSGRGHDDCIPQTL